MTDDPGDWEIDWEAYACWLEIRSQGAGCYPDPGYPPYPD